MKKQRYLYNEKREIGTYGEKEVHKEKVGYVDRDREREIALGTLMTVGVVVVGQEFNDENYDIVKIYNC